MVVCVEGINKVIVLIIDGEVCYVYNNLYEGGKMVVVEVYWNLIVVGVILLVMIDCLNYGFFEKKEIY